MDDSKTIMSGYLGNSNNIDFFVCFYFQIKNVITSENKNKIVDNTIFLILFNKLFK